MKLRLIMFLVRLLIWGVTLGLGVWYLSSSLGGAALTYTSMDNFMTAIGAGDGNIANVNGCFMCKYVAEIFGVIGNAAEVFWTAMLDNIWILLAIGFGIFLFVHTAQYIFDAAKKTASLDAQEKKLEFAGWFDRVWKLAARIMIVGVLLGAVGTGGTSALRTVANITITPVMFAGTELAMAATGVTDAAQCGAFDTSSDDILNPILQPFMCVMGNLNSVMLAGAAGGFALMNYAWLGMGGGAFTWVAGLGLVILFLIIGFRLFFQVLSVVFKLVFLIIFLPLLLAAAAFEGTWSMADGITKGAINMLAKSALQIVSITLKILIIYATISFAADEMFPGPNDGYSAILPPMMGQVAENPDAQTMSVMNVFAHCERVALVDGEMNADKFKDCFTAQRAMVEREYPGAFDFLANGWDFILMMIFLFLMYYYVLEPRVNAILGKAGAEQFDFGGWVKGLGKTVWGFPMKIFESVANALGKKS